jgi:hypothetical protein
MSRDEPNAGDVHNYSGRIGWKCGDCGRIVSIYDREFHRNVICPGGSE